MVKKVTIQFIQGVDIYKEATRIMLLYLPYTFFSNACICPFSFPTSIRNVYWSLSFISQKLQVRCRSWIMIFALMKRKDEVGEVGK